MCDLVIRGGGRFRLTTRYVRMIIPGLEQRWYGMIQAESYWCGAETLLGLILDAIDAGESLDYRLAFDAKLRSFSATSSGSLSILPKNK